MQEKLIVDRVQPASAPRKRWETARPTLFLYEHLIRWGDRIPKPARIPGALNEELRHYELGKSVTRSLVHANPSRRAVWAKEILAEVSAQAIQRLVFDEESPLQEVLLFRLSGNRGAVFYRFADGRVYTCVIHNFHDEPGNLYAFAKILALDPTRRPSPQLMKGGASIVPMALEFFGSENSDVRLLTDAEAIRMQFYDPITEAFNLMLKRYGSLDNPGIVSAKRRLWRFYLRDALIVMRRFLAPLDNDALAVARPNSVNGAMAYHYYAVAEPRTRLYRQQAARSFPILAGLLPRWHGAADDILRVHTSATRQWHLSRLGIGNVDYPNRLDAVRAVDPRTARLALIAETIDESKSLNAALAEALSLSPATIKSLRSGSIGYPRLEKFEVFCTLFDCIPVNLRPQSDEDFQMLDAIVDKLKRILRPHALPADVAGRFHERQIGIIRRWLQPVAKDAHRRGWKAAFNHIDIDVGDLQDFLNALAAWIAERTRTDGNWPALRRFNTYGERFGEHKLRIERNLVCAYEEFLKLFERESVRRIGKLSADWHQAIPHCRREVAVRMGLRSGGHRGDSILPMIIRRPRQVEGLFVVPLLSPHTLDAEGLAMMHCVGSYSYQARRFDSLLFSIRTPDGVRLSTLELRPEIVRLETTEDNGTGATTVRFEIEQHKGPRNSAPSQKAQQAVFMFLRDANNFRCDFTTKGSIDRIRRVRRRRTPAPGAEMEFQISLQANAMALARLLPEMLEHWR